MKDEYVLFWFKMSCVEETLENPSLFGKFVEKHGKQEFVIARSHNRRLSGHDYDKASCTDGALVEGEFESLEEAKLRLAVEGWEMVDVTNEFEADEFVGRRIVKAFRLVK